MKEIEKIDITSCTVEDRRKVLNGLEVKLSDAKAQRDRILIDVRKASAAADAGDQRARFAQGGLNKEDAAAGRLILSLGAQIAEARKRLAMAMNQAAVIEAKSHAAAAIPGAGEAKWFAVTTPDGRLVRHRAASLEALRKALLPNYAVTAEIFGASDQGSAVLSLRSGPARSQPCQDCLRRMATSLWRFWQSVASRQHRRTRKWNFKRYCRRTHRS